MFDRDHPRIDRHQPRLCRSCQAPMGGQEDSCWRCGRYWATPAAEDQPAVGQERGDTERWTDEGGAAMAERAPLAVGGR